MLSKSKSLKIINTYIKFSIIIMVTLIATFLYLRPVSYAIDDIDRLRKTCVTDLRYIAKILIDHSAGYNNPHDPYFAKWLHEGLEHTEQLLEEIMDKDDCYFAINYYLNGFSEKNLQLIHNFPMPVQQYPGILTAYINGYHKVIYKLPGIDSLQEIKIGDKLLAINDIDMDNFFHDNIAPFYSYNNSAASYKAASTMALIEDGNKFVPTPLKALFQTQNAMQNDPKNGLVSIDLQYTSLNKQALRILLKYQLPSITTTKVNINSSGAWIHIPSFFPNQEEKIIFQGMLSSLKDLAKQDCIVFDLRGNSGGNPALAQAVVRNLYGDLFLKSLGDKHSYNHKWSYNTRLSKVVLEEFKKLHDKKQVKLYSQDLNSQKIFFEELYDVYTSRLSLYSSDHSEKIHAQIVVLTDNHCSGTCWSFVNEMRQIPGVKHFGAITNIGSFYDRTMRVTTPSQNFGLIFPIRFMNKPGMELGTAIEPHKKYMGDFYNDVELMDWVLLELDDE